MTEQPEDAYPVAYCAPGNRGAAEAILTARGEHVARIVEHPWLEGVADIYVAAAKPIDLTDLLPLSSEVREPGPSLPWFRDLCRYGLLMNPPRMSLLMPTGI